MRIPTRLLTSIAAISVALTAPAARAQNAEAESLFEQGDALMNQHKIPEACQAFEASNKIEMRAGTLIRLGDCREQNHQIASAWSAYKDALTRVKDENKKQIATDKVASLGPRLSYLRVNVPPASQLTGLEVTRDGHVLDPAEWNHPLPIDGGTYTIEAHAPGLVTWKGSAVVPDEHGQISVDVPALVVDPHAHATPAPAPTSPSPPPESSSWTGKRKVGVAMAGVAVLAGIGGVIFGEMANSKLADADAQCDPQRICPSAAALKAANDDHSAATARALDANIAFGVAGAAAITAGILWLTGAPERQSVAVGVAHGSAVLTLSGRF